MENFNKLFANVVESACKCADEISNPYEKATVYTNLAQAIAQTGNVNNVAFSGSDVVEEMYEETTSNMGSEDKKPESKEDLEAAPPKKKPTAKKSAEKKEETPKQQSQEEPEWTDEWTEEAEAHFADDWAKIDAFQDDFELTDEELNEYVCDFFKAKSGKTIDDITPQNIKAFCAFVEALIAQADEEDAKSA